MADLIGVRPAARLLRPIRAHLVVCAVLSAAGGAAGLAPFVAIAEIARVALSATGPGVAGAVWAWVGAGAAGAVLRLVLVGVSSHVGHLADARMVHELRVAIVRRLGALPLGWFRTSGSAQVQKAMTSDLEAMHSMFAHGVAELCGAAGALVAGVAYLSTVDVRMALVTFAVPAVQVVAYRTSMRSMPGHVERLLAAERRLASACVEYTDGIEVVKAFGSEHGPGRRVVDRFADAVHEQAEALRTWVAEIRHRTALGRVLASELTVLVVVLAAGSALLAGGSLTAVDLLPFLVVGVGLPTSVAPLIHGTIGLRTARMAAGHLDRLLALEPLPDPARPRHPDGHDLEFDHVSFSYDGRVDAVHDLSAVCRAGTVTALVGPSGAGKSTVTGLVPRFHDVTGGAIRIGGVDVREMDQETLLGSLSLVFQDVVLLRDTVTENIRVGDPGASTDDVRRAARAARIHDVIERLPDGYDTVLGDGGGLSGGERQRVTIARAILSRAPIVLLDEATAALDPDHEAAVQDALDELARGRTVLVVAHRLHTVVEADQILVLDAGRLVEAGTHPELVSRGGVYARLWAAADRARSPR